MSDFLGIMLVVAVAVVLWSLMIYRWYLEDKELENNLAMENVPVIEEKPLSAEMLGLSKQLEYEMYNDPDLICNSSLKNVIYHDVNTFNTYELDAENWPDPIPYILSKPKTKKSKSKKTKKKSKKAKK